LRGRQLIKFAIDEHPACGTPPKVLAYHGLSGDKLAVRILLAMKDNPDQLLEAAS